MWVPRSLNVSVMEMDSPLMNTGVLRDGWCLRSTASSSVFDVLSKRVWSLHQVAAWSIHDWYSVSWLLVMSPVMVESSAYLHRLTELWWDVSWFV